MSIKIKWTDEKIATLRRMWKAGVVSADIAAAVGTTTMAVRKKASKLKLERRSLGFTGKPAVAKKAKIAAVTSVEPEAVTESGAHLTTLTIGRNQCRYPHGDVGSPDFHFCGQKTAPGKSWCPYHYGRVFHREKVKSADERDQINRAVAAQRKWAA